jgi:hypothetical protein
MSGGRELAKIEEGLDELRHLRPLRYTGVSRPEAGCGIEEEG